MLYWGLRNMTFDTFEVIGQLAKNVDPKVANQEFIVNLKLEVDVKCSIRR
jgi:hypothetical protein